MSPVQFAVLILLLPLASAVIIALFGLRRSGTAGVHRDRCRPRSPALAVVALNLVFGGARN